MLRLCSVRCPHMNEITLEQTRDSLQVHALARSTCRRTIRVRALRAVERMLAVGPEESIERRPTSHRRPGHRLRHCRRHGGARAGRGRTRRDRDHARRPTPASRTPSGRRAASSSAARTIRPDLLAKDILHAGRATATRRPCSMLAEEGPPLVQSILIDRLGVPFDRTPDGGCRWRAKAGTRCRASSTSPTPPAKRSRTH